MILFQETPIVSYKLPIYAFSQSHTHTHAVFDLQFPIWGFGERCKIIRGITEQLANVLNFNVLPC